MSCAGTVTSCVSLLPGDGMSSQALTLPLASAAEHDDAKACRILAIDPGPTHAGVVDYEGRVISASKMPNAEVLDMLTFVFDRDVPHLAIEMVASYGMAVGREVFETVRWIGRFQQAWHSPDDVMLVYRLDVKMHLCHNAKAKDTNIRQALIDMLGAPGTKKNPGATYGVAGDMWAALGVAVTADAKLRGLAK